MALNPSTAGSSGAAVVRARLNQIREIERSAGPSAAETALVAYLREGEQSAPAFLALARVLAKQGRNEDAIRAAARAKALAPLEAEPLVAIGLVNLRMDRPSVAAEAFADAIRLEPQNARAYLGAAAVKMAAEDYDDALALVDRVLDLDPTLERAHELMARVKVRMGRQDEAVEALRDLVRRSPGNRRVLRAYIRLMRQADRGDEALSFLEQDAAANPGDRRRQSRFAQVAALSGRADVATEQFEALDRDGGAGPGARVRYASLLTQAGELDRARAVIAELGPQPVLRPVALTLEGDVALKAGDPAEAMRQYQAACRAAGMDGLDPADEARGGTPEERARIWRAYVRRSLAAALKERRSAPAD